MGISSRRGTVHYDQCSSYYTYNSQNKSLYEEPTNPDLHVYAACRNNICNMGS